MSKCAFDDGVRCTALKEKECRGCSFYKTKEELQAGRDKAEALVSKLDLRTKNHIREKYYGGRRAFRDERETN